MNYLYPGIFPIPGFFMSLNKAQISYLRSLHESKSRKQSGEFIAEGVKVVEELLNSNYSIRKIYALQEWLPLCPPDKKSLLEVISPKELERISALSTPNMVLATAEMPCHKIEEMSFATSITLALDGITDPGNMGTIIRTADWFGIRQIVCSPGSVDIYNPKVVQAAMGSLFRMQIAYGSLDSFLEKEGREVPVYGTFIEETSIVSHHLSKEGIIIIGSESHGISSELFPFIHHRISIPRPAGSAAKTESLNAAIATAIVCYEFTRKSGQLL